MGLSGEQVAACRQRLDALRWEFYRSLTRWSGALFEPADAVLCAPGPVTSLPELSLAGVHRRGHGSTYAALADGRIDVDWLRVALARLELPRGVDGQIRLAVDVTPWPRPDAECSPQRAHAHRPCRCDGVRQTIPGWPYSIVAVLESGRSSWTAPLDAVRLVPGQDATEVTAGQIRQVFGRLRTAGQWRTGDPPVLVVHGHDAARRPSWCYGATTRQQHRVARWSVGPDVRDGLLAPTSLVPGTAGVPAGEVRMMSLQFVPPQAPTAQFVPAAPPSAPTKPTRRLLACGIVGGPLFVVVVLVQGMVP